MSVCVGGVQKRGGGGRGGAGGWRRGRGGRGGSKCILIFVVLKVLCRGMNGCMELFGVTECVQ